MSLAPFSTAGPITTRTHRFHHELVSRSFIEQTGARLVEAKSVVLVGAHGVGKTRILADVLQRFTRDDRYQVIQVPCDSFSKAVSEKAIVQEIISQLKGVSFLAKDFRGLHEELRLHLEQTPCHLILACGSLDQLPSAFARRLLIIARELRGLGEAAQGKFSVLVSGSVDIVPLVYGADSEFTADYQSVVHGFDEAFFIEHANQQSDTVVARSPPDVQRLLHKICGGSLLLLQIILNAVSSTRRRVGQSLAGEISATELHHVTELLSDNQFLLTDALRPAFSRAESSQQSLLLLRKLLKSDELPVPIPNSSETHASSETAPTELELCGLAVRDQQLLRWRCSLIQRLAQQYFSARVLGDAFALNNCWEEAKGCYQEAEDYNEPWIDAGRKRPGLQAAYRAFEAKVHAIAGEGDNPIERLMTFFAEGVRHTVGFDSVIRWSKNTQQSEWNAEHVYTRARIHSSETDRIRTLLPASISPKAGLIEVTERADYPFVVLIGLPGTDGFSDEILALSSLHSETPLTQFRREQITAVAQAFCFAYERAQRKRSTSTMIRYQKHLLDALPDVFRMIGQAPERTKGALKKAGDTLREYGYRRVMFSLVDQASQRIQGVIDCREDNEFDLAAITDYVLIVPADGLGTERRDIQQECVLRRETIRVPNASDWPTTNKDAVEKARLQGMALIPIQLCSTGEVLGTMHIERCDRRELSDEEVATLQYFTEQLAEAIAAASRVDFLDDALQQHGDALVLLNHADEVVFANQNAAKMFKVPSQWLRGEDRVLGRNCLPAILLDVVKLAKEHNHTVSRYVDQQPGGKNVVTARPLTDWRETRSGVLLQIQNIEVTSVLWQSIRDFAACTDRQSLSREVLRAIRDRGHKWARLYLIDESLSVLRGWDQFGMQPGEPGANDFVTRSLLLKRRNESPISWKCFDYGHPIVLEMAAEGEAETEDTTSTGLQYFKVSDSGYERPYLLKTPGVRWIEVPLCSKDRRRQYGKLTIECPEMMTLDDMERLRILAEAAGAAFAAFADLEEQQQQQLERNRSAAELALERTCHQLQSNITSFSTLKRRYKHARTQTQIDELNADWDKRQVLLETVLRKTMGHLRPIQPEFRCIDLVEEVSRIAVKHVGADRCDVRCVDPNGATAQSLAAACDVSLIEEALDELVLNSRKAAGEPLRIELQLSQREAPLQGERLIQIRYQDNGPGISPQVADCLFEEFCSHWPNEGVEGTGLGLSLVQRIIRAHGGRIWNEPCDGGACFIIEFPKVTRSETRTSANHFKASEG